MNFNHKIEEKRKKYSNTKLITKYKNKLSASAHPFFPKENNQKKFVEKEIEDDMEKIEVTMPEDVNTQNNPERFGNIKRYLFTSRRSQRAHKSIGELFKCNEYG